MNQSSSKSFDKLVCRLHKNRKVMIDYSTSGLLRRLGLLTQQASLTFEGYMYIKENFQPFIKFGYFHTFYKSPKAYINIHISIPAT